jgi:hypothetical protein
MVVKSEGVVKSHKSIHLGSSQHRQERQKAHQYRTTPCPFQCYYQLLSGAKSQARPAHPPVPHYSFLLFYGEGNPVEEFYNIRYSKQPVSLFPMSGGN